MKDAFAKKFLVPGEIPLAVLAFRYRLDSEQFRSAPRTCHGAGGRLRMRRADCEGGSPRVRYTTARFRHPAWLRRDGCVAARGARAAGGNATDHRVLWPEHGLGLESVDRCFCAAAARTRLNRGPQPRDQVSLGGRTQRALHRDRGRVRSAQGRRHCHGWQRGCRGKAGVIGCLDRLRAGRRSG